MGPLLTHLLATGLMQGEAFNGLGCACDGSTRAGATWAGGEEEDGEGDEGQGHHGQHADGEAPVNSWNIASGKGPTAEAQTERVMAGPWMRPRPCRP